MTEVTSLEDHKTEKAHQQLLDMGKVDALHMCSNSFVHMLGNVYREYQETGQLSTNTLAAIKEIYNNWEDIEKDIRNLN